MARVRQVERKHKSIGADEKKPDTAVADAMGLAVVPTDDTIGKKKRKPRRFRPGTVALREIRRYQKDGGNLIAKAPFRRVVRETANRIGELLYNKGGYKITESAFEALQISAEAYVLGMLRLSGAFARHADRIELMPWDMHLAVKLVVESPHFEQQGRI